MASHVIFAPLSKTESLPDIVVFIGEAQPPMGKYAFCRRLTGAHQSADDLAQETFVRIYQHRARFRAGARFSTWMFQIALNLARSRARWRRRRLGYPGPHG